MAEADFIVIGGGIAGLSAAARLAGHGRVLLIEAEETIGYHSSSRSVTFSHFGIGDSTVRGLTAWSRDFFLQPPDGFADHPISMRTPALFVAREEAVPQLDALAEITARFTDTSRMIGTEEARRICPVLRTGPGEAVAALVDTGGLRLDPHALLQGFARIVRAGGGEVVTGQRVSALSHENGLWTAASETGGRWSAPVVVNAAGAWADRIAEMAGVRPLGLEPKRRTIIVFDPPAGTDVSGWPFLKSVIDEFYMLPDAGRLLASPVDEVPSDPCDARPDDYEVALAAWQVERYTTLPVPRITHKWAGLRTFTTDRVPTAGFAPDAPGFFWLAGQGGYGLQTAPAMAAIVEALATGGDWPAGLAERGVRPEQIRPDRLL